MYNLCFVSLDQIQIHTQSAVADLASLPLGGAIRALAQPTPQGWGPTDYFWVTDSAEIITEKVGIQEELMAIKLPLCETDSATHLDLLGIHHGTGHLIRTGKIVRSVLLQAYIFYPYIQACEHMLDDDCRGVVRFVFRRLPVSLRNQILGLVGSPSIPFGILLRQHTNVLYFGHNRRYYRCSDIEFAIFLGTFRNEGSLIVKVVKISVQALTVWSRSGD